MENQDDIEVVSDQEKPPVKIRSAENSLCMTISEKEMLENLKNNCKEKFKTLREHIEKWNKDIRDLAQKTLDDISNGIKDLETEANKIDALAEVIAKRVDEECRSKTHRSRADLWIDELLQDASFITFEKFPRDLKLPEIPKSVYDISCKISFPITPPDEQDGGMLEIIKKHNIELDNKKYKRMMNESLGTGSYNGVYKNNYSSNYGNSYYNNRFAGEYHTPNIPISPNNTASSSPENGTSKPDPTAENVEDEDWLTAGIEVKSRYTGNRAIIKSVEGGNVIYEYQHNKMTSSKNIVFFKREFEKQIEYKASWGDISYSH